MSVEPLISVVVAVYNMEKYLCACVDSVLAQTEQRFELVLVNDGSTDASEEIIQEYIAKDPERIRTIKKENGGLSSARNIALPTLRGKYVTFLDADDWLDKNYLKILSEKAEAEDLDMVCSGQHKVEQDGTILKTIHYTVENGQCLQRRLNISGKLYRTDYVHKWNLTFPEGKTYEDNSFNLQALFLSPKIGFLEYEGYNQVVHEGSITAAPIDPAKLPFDEWNRVAGSVQEAAVPGVDLQLFAFTFVSFLTYFLLVRNRKREYLSNDGKTVNTSGVDQIAEVFQSLVNTHFPDYRENSYTGLLSNRSLPMAQKLGTRVFARYCRKMKLKNLVRLVYRVA